MGPEFSNTEEGKEGGDGGGPVLPRRARYLHPLEFYEGIYGTRVRAMKRWIAIGRDADPPELPPLDEPARMKAWWVRCMAQRVPDKILDLAKPGAVAAPIAPASPPTVDPARDPLFAHAAAAPAPSLALGLPARNGFAGALQRVRESEVGAGELYKSLLAAAAAAPDPDTKLRLSADAEQARRSWEKLVDQLREMERDAVKILPSTTAMWTADDVVASLTVIHLALRDGVRGLLRRTRPKLQGLTPTEQDAIWSGEVESLFAALRANKFTAPPSLGESSASPAAA